MEIEGSPFPEAVQTVAEKMGIPIPAPDNSREYEEADRRRADLLQLNQWAAEFFELNLTGTGEGKRALEYLDRRGLTEQTRKTFRIGYAPNTWDSMGNFLRTRGASRSQIESSGLVTLKESRGETSRNNDNGFYDRFRGRLMFPITDAQGRIIAFGGRIIGDGEPKYLNSPETALYTKGHNLFGLHFAKEAIRKRGYVVLVEGYLDFLVPFQAGVQNLVASLGTALTDHQVKLLGRYVRQIVVNFDPDSAGVAATRRSLEVLLTNGFKVNVLTLPENLDPDEFIGKYGAESYQKLLRTSSRFLDYIVEQAVRTHDQATPSGKVETINEILPYLKLVSDRIEVLEYVDRIADRLRIDSKLIRNEFRKAVEARQERVREQIAMVTLAVKPAEQTLLELILADGDVRRAVLANLTEDDYRGLRTAELFRVLIRLEEQGIEPTWRALTEELEDDDLAQNLLPRLLSESSILESDGEEEIGTERQRKAYESIHGLRCAQLAERQVALQLEINQAQRDRDDSALQQLLIRKTELAHQERELGKWSSR
jgi:DNA primase